MGLFSFVGKAVGGLVKTVGGLAVGALKSGLVPLPIGGVAGRLLGGLLHAKAPMGHTQLKLRIPPLVLRGKTLRPVVKIGTANHVTATALRKSPVLPGGAIASRAGVAPRPLGLQAGGFQTASGKPKRKRRRRRSGSSSSSSRRSYRSSGKRHSRRRKLKFGSPAWRKKYLGHGRKRRKRRAA